MAAGVRKAGAQEIGTSTIPAPMSRLDRTYTRFDAAWKAVRIEPRAAFSIEAIRLAFDAAEPGAYLVKYAYYHGWLTHTTARVSRSAMRTQAWSSRY